MQRKAGWLLCGLLVLGLPPTHSTHAADEDEVILRIRARSTLQLSEVQRDEAPGAAGLRVSFLVQLTDGPSQVGLPDLPVQVRVMPQAGSGRTLLKSLVTDSRGHTTALFDLEPGLHYQISAHYAGDSLRDPADATLQCDLLRLQAHLHLSAPDSVPLSGTLSLGVSLSTDREDLDGTLSGPVVLYLLGRKVPVPLSRGRGEVSLAVSALGGKAGEVHGGTVLRVLLAYPGDLKYASAQISKDVLVTTQAQVSLDPPAPPSGEAPRGGRLMLTGSASDEDGPLAREPIEILGRAAAGGETDDGTILLGSAATDQSGRFRVVSSHLPLPVGPAQLFAQALPDRSYRRSARSVPVPLTVLPPEPVSVLYYLLPLVLTALCLLCGLGWRRRHSLLSSLRRLHRWFVPVPEEADAVGTAPAGQPGVRLSQKNRVQVLLQRRATDLEVDGHVGDATFGRAVPGASIVVHPAGEPGAKALHANIMEQHSDPQGHFALHGLPAGSYRIEVSCSGYLPESFAAVLPHRGELRGVRILLSPIRVRILMQWCKIALPLLPPLGELNAQLTIWTPREILQRAQAAQQSAPPHLPQLAELTALVEDAYYSSRVCTPEMLERAVSLSTGIAAQQSPGPPSPALPRKSRIVPQAPP